MRNRISGLLMETGVSYNKLRLHRMGYFQQLLSTNEEISDSVRPLLQLCREHIDRSIRLDRTLLRSLNEDPMLSERLERLRTVPGVGPITALTWVLEVGDTSSECFGTGSEHKLNLLRRPWRPEAANGCPVLQRMQEPLAERHTCATAGPDQQTTRAPEREQRPCASSLTDDLHGGRLLSRPAEIGSATFG